MPNPPSLPAPPSRYWSTPVQAPRHVLPPPPSSVHRRLDRRPRSAHTPAPLLLHSHLPPAIFLSTSDYRRQSPNTAVPSSSVHCSHHSSPAAMPHACHSSPRPRYHGRAPPSPSTGPPAVTALQFLSIVLLCPSPPTPHRLLLVPASTAHLPKLFTVPLPFHAISARALPLFHPVLVPTFELPAITIINQRMPMAETPKPAAR